MARLSQAQAAAGGGGGSLLGDMPEFLLPFLIFLLAHHPDYPTEEVGAWGRGRGGRGSQPAAGAQEAPRSTSRTACSTTVPCSSPLPASLRLSGHLPRHLLPATRSACMPGPWRCRRCRSLPRRTRRSARRCTARAARPSRPLPACCRRARQLGTSATGGLAATAAVGFSLFQRGRPCPTGHAVQAPFCPPALSAVCAGGAGGAARQSHHALRGGAPHARPPQDAALPQVLR